MIAQVLAVAALYLGLVIAAVGVLGVYRFPDVYTRLNSLSKVTTVGAVLIHLSTAALLPLGEGGKGVLTALVLLLTTPVVSQVISWTAHRLRVPSANYMDELEGHQGSS
jgi:multicomponent Na+:H+ antiporter subunit G